MPRKGYKPPAGGTRGMPEKIAAQHFNRRISPAEVQILHAAGFGSKTDGFRNLLGLYQELHNMGYRCDISIKEFTQAMKTSTGCFANTFQRNEPCPQSLMRKLG
jgi:hypothetical protein